MDLLTAGSRITLSQVRDHPSGAHFPEPAVLVEPADDGHTGRLDIGNPTMMADLERWASSSLPTVAGDDDFAFRLICRRHAHVYNSSCNVPATNRGRAYNPAYVHPDDLAALGARAGDVVELRSPTGTLPAIVQPDPDLRRGLVSMVFGFGAGPERDAEVREIGSSVNRLIGTDALFDRYTGQPRMSNVPVDVRVLLLAPPVP